MGVRWYGFIFGTRGCLSSVKNCGCVGHCTSYCRLSVSAAHRQVRRRVAGFESYGFRVLSDAMHLPYYSNVIEGLPDRFRHRNVRVDLLHLGQDPVKGDLGTPSVGHDGFYSSSVPSDDDVVSGFSFASDHSSSMQDDCGVLKKFSGKQDTGVTAPTMVSPKSEESN